MEIINQFLVQPNVKFLELAPYLVNFLMLFHLPYLGMVLGTSTLSVAYSKWQPGLSADLSQLAPGKTGAILVFGLLPPAALAFLYKMQIFNALLPIHLYLLRILAVLLAGLLLLSLFRRRANIFIGVAGVLLVSVYAFLFTNLSALLILPEKWHFISATIPYPLFSIIPLVHFAIFSFLALIMTGAAILFFRYKWPETRLAKNTPYFQLLKFNGFALLIAGSLALPLFVLWDLTTLPNYALSIPVFILAALTILVLSVLGYTASHMILNRENRSPRFTVFVFILAIVLFGLTIGKNHILQVNGGREARFVLADDSRKTRNEIVAQREEIYAKNMVIDPALGERIYKDRCTACHSFDKTILGPPFITVLPKYSGKEAELTGFIRNPVKVNPNYPSMPNPGLTTIQAKSVAAYLLEKIGGNTPEEDKGVDRD